MSIDAMKQALEALEEINKLSVGENAICLPAEIDRAMDALRAAIEQAQEPVAWLVQYPNKHEFVWGEKPQWIADAVGIEPLYTAPQPRQWQGLTDEEIAEVRHLYDWTAGWTIERFARAIEAKLKEKNT